MKKLFQREQCQLLFSSTFPSFLPSSVTPGNIKTTHEQFTGSSKQIHEGHPAINPDRFQVFSVPYKKKQQSLLQIRSLRTVLNSKHSCPVTKIMAIKIRSRLARHEQTLNDVKVSSNASQTNQIF